MRVVQKDRVVEPVHFIIYYVAAARQEHINPPKLELPIREK